MLNRPDRLRGGFLIVIMTIFSSFYSIFKFLLYSLSIVRCPSSIQHSEKELSIFFKNQYFSQDFILKSVRSSKDFE